jgi:hypothetical protein
MLSSARVFPRYDAFTADYSSFDASINRHSVQGQKLVEMLGRAHAGNSIPWARRRLVVKGHADPQHGSVHAAAERGLLSLLASWSKITPPSL